MVPALSKEEGLKFPTNKAFYFPKYKLEKSIKIIHTVRVSNPRSSRAFRRAFTRSSVKAVP